MENEASFEKEKVKEVSVVSKIETTIFKLEISATTTYKELDETVSRILSVFEKNYARIEKLGEIQSIRPTIESKEYKENYPFKEISEPMINIARKLNVDPEKIIGNNLFGFKEDKPQIFDHAKFKSANRAVRALIYLFEYGLNRKSISKEELEEAYEISKIKGRKVYQILKDLREDGQIEKDKITLTAKGVKETENELRVLLSL
jgi:hypothetical protein